ncbi:MAG: adenylyl-sulfate kinase [bacterium]
MISRDDRDRRLGHGSAVIWITGLSGSGKTSIAHGVEAALAERGVHSYVLDGDNIRQGLCSDLGFSDEDREENIRRIGELSRLFVDAGLVVIAAFISPFRRDRDRARALFGEREFFEIYLKCDLATCEERDPKGLYRKARAGEIKDFTGISSPYEEPLEPELTLDTAELSLLESVGRVMALLEYLWS